VADSGAVTEEVVTALVHSVVDMEGIPVVEVDIPVEMKGTMTSVSYSLIFVRTDLFILIGIF
jgi:hypothetical protein